MKTFKTVKGATVGLIAVAQHGGNIYVCLEDRYGYPHRMLQFTWRTPTVFIDKIVPHKRLLDYKREYNRTYMPWAGKLTWLI